MSAAPREPCAALLGDERPSFVLWDAVAELTPARVQAAAAAYAAALATVPAELRAAIEVEHAAHAAECASWLGRFNRSLRGRVAGYLALGERVAFEYPWPVVAILGVSRVEAGLRQNHLWGLAAAALAAAGREGLALTLDAAEDSLRRTNRAIFADSVPVVLYALRCHALRGAGRAALADALVRGPLPLAMDAECRALIAGLDAALGLASREERFGRLAALTLRHFGREQAVFSFHLVGARSRRPVDGVARGLVAPRSVVAPRLTRRRRGPPRLTFASFALPEGFDLRDHDARVEAFGRAFVASVTGSAEDYGVATEWVRARYGRR